MLLFCKGLVGFSGMGTMGQKSERSEGTSQVDIRGKRFPAKGNRKWEN